jgi:YegS/Rv2252/BmrU family lipid kinase
VYSIRISALDTERSTVTDSSIVVVRNPRSGDGQRTQQAAKIARSRGYEVLDSSGGKHTIELAADAATRAETVIACGGDGTLNKTVQGVLSAGRLDDISLGVIPAGTGNDFADNIGIRGIEHAFEVIDQGRERRLDLGMANSKPFCNSCVAGLTAESSGRTSRHLKRRLGVLAYVLTTLSTMRTFEASELHVSVGPDADPAWTGDALMLLAGNARCFPGERMRQANMEDGLINVIIIEDAPALNYLSTGAVDKLFRRGATHLTRLKTSHLAVSLDGEPIQFSLDGELIETDRLTADSRPGALRFCVGPSYDPNPPEWGQ